MKHTIMCSCGKLAIRCEEASKAIEDFIQFRLKELSRNSKEKKECNFLYADWCHNPKFDEQTKCSYYHGTHECPDYSNNEEEIKKEIMSI